MDSELLASYGIDYKRGLSNCMDNLPFYKKILAMFLNDTCFSAARIAFEQDDRKELFNRMHEMKGISGNMALTELYRLTSLLVELLRSEGGNPDEISRLFGEAQKAYDRAKQGISLFIEQ